MTVQEAKSPHSAEYLGIERDFWWNEDFVSLTAQRLRLKQVRSVLDVGCGLGHWGLKLLPHLRSGARLTGLDREPVWIKDAKRIASRAGLGRRTHFQVGSADSLPFDDFSFDLVTCQTLLIHVADPMRVISEMLRVTRVGGQVLLVEPNNLAAAFVYGSTTFALPWADRLKLAKLQAICETGKASVGEGNDSFGDLVPGKLSAAGGNNVKVYLSDCASPLIPPYEGPAQQAVRNQILDWARRGYWLWEKRKAKQYFLAGGGSAADFDDCWSLAIANLRNVARDIRASVYHGAGGGIMYMTSATR
jgi:SAM-dependent methyltransferase